MDMTAEEICRHYRMAKDKKGDIKVLADLNATNKDSIKAVLVAGGLLEPEKKKEPTVKTKNHREMVQFMHRRFRQGKTSKEIADELGCTPQTVRNHRKQWRKKQEKKKQGETTP